VTRTGSAPAPRRPEIGLRREVRILGPVALLLLVLVSAFTLFSYRSAVGLLVEERREAALGAGRALAERLASGEATPDAAGLSALRRTAPGVRSLTLVDADGGELAVAGELPGGDPTAPFAGSVAAGDMPREEVAAGPGPELPGVVAALVPLTVRGEPRWLRVDLAEPVLAARARTLTALTWVVLGVGAGVGLLVLLFLRHLMGPYDALLARARQLGPADGPAGEEDEIEFLVRTFERGMAALAAGGNARAVGGADDRAELAAVERALGESLESGLLMLDREGRVLALNPVGAALLDVPPPSPGAPLEEALAAHPGLVELLAEAVSAAVPLQRREVELDRPGGEGTTRSPLTLGLTVNVLRAGPDPAVESPAAAGGGHPAQSPEDRPRRRAVRGFLVLFADLTEVRRQAEQDRLAESLVQLGEMAAGVAHELRNSLATLRGYLSLIERRPGEPARDHLDEMRRETEHLQRVLDDFLSFAQPGSVRLEEVALGELVTQAASDPTLGGAPVRIEDAGLAGLRLRGDRQLLERALRNLVRNAARAAAEGAGGQPASVEIGLVRSDEGVEVVVADRGPGVPAHLRGRLFHPFVTGRPDGVGLGLALTQRIVALHGGSVRLEDRPGGGTNARVRFPPGTIVT